MTAIQLSTGALKGLFSKADHAKWEGKPLTLQCTNFKLYTTELGPRYRVRLTDGMYVMHGLVSPSFADVLSRRNLQKYCYVKLTPGNYALTYVSKHIMLISGLDLLEDGKKLPQELIDIDTYFQQHPEDDLSDQAVTERGQALLREFQMGTGAGNLPSPMDESGTKAAATAPSSTTPAAPTASSLNQKAQRSIEKSLITPIDQLSPYQNNWKIKARLSYKGDMRTWSNQRGEGKLVNFNFLDESDEIRATAFNEWADKFSNMLEKDKVYYVSKARMQQSKPQFSRLSHLYELTLDKDTEISECMDTTEVPKVHFNFVSLDKIQNFEPNSIVDVIGVIKEVNPVFQVTARTTGKSFDRRNLTLVDSTGFALQLGLWNTAALEFSQPEGTVVAFKGVKIQEFNGRSLTMTPSGSMIPNPDVKEAYTLKGWYDNEGSHQDFKTMKTESNSTSRIENRKLIAEADSENLGKSDKADYFTIKATISFFKPDNFCYNACPNDVPSANNPNQTLKCNRKLIDVNNTGLYRCERCDKEYSEPNHRYIASVSVIDSSGQMWLTLFDEEANKLVGMNANELLKLKDDPFSEFSEIMSSFEGKEYAFRVRAKQQTFNDETRVRYQCVSLYDLNYNDEAEYLTQKLEQVLS